MNKTIIKKALAVFLVALTLALTCIGAVNVGAKEITSGRFQESEFKATEIEVGEKLWINTFRDIYNEGVREYSLSLDYPNLNGGQYDYMPHLGHTWGDLDGNGYFSDWCIAYDMTHDGSDEGYWFDPETMAFYDYLEVRIYFRNIDRSEINPESISVVTDYYEPEYSTPENPRFDYVNALQFDEVGTYRYKIYLRFWYQGENIGTNISNSDWQTLIVKPSTMYEQGYYEGHSNGYNAGYTDGIESSQEYDMYSMITTLVASPITFVKEALNFDVFGVNIAGFVTMLFTLLLILLVVVVIVRFIV